MAIQFYVPLVNHSLKELYWVILFVSLEIKSMKIPLSAISECDGIPQGPSRGPEGDTLSQSRN